MSGRSGACPRRALRYTHGRGERYRPIDPSLPLRHPSQVSQAQYPPARTSNNTAQPT